MALEKSFTSRKRPIATSNFCCRFLSKAIERALFFTFSSLKFDRRNLAVFLFFWIMSLTLSVGLCFGLGFVYIMGERGYFEVRWSSGEAGFVPCPFHTNSPVARACPRGYTRT